MKFVVTGFKEFSGVKENPTEYIVKNLQVYLKIRGRPLPGISEAGNKSMCSLPTRLEP